jgi:hypothetical protein
MLQNYWVCGSQTLIFHHLYESVLPEFDHYREIYTFLDFLVAISTRINWDKALAAQLYVFLSA